MYINAIWNEKTGNRFFDSFCSCHDVIESWITSADFKPSKQDLRDFTNVGVAK